MWALIFGHHRCWPIVSLVLFIPGWQWVVWYHFITCFCGNTGITILFLFADEWSAKMILWANRMVYFYLLFSFFTWSSQSMILVLFVLLSTQTYSNLVFWISRVSRDKVPVWQSPTHDKNGNILIQAGLVFTFVPKTSLSRLCPNGTQNKECRTSYIHSNQCSNLIYVSEILL